jgi:Pyruvate/2-oxoacid:ferredoxin oxidoreductase delta subunit
MGHLVGKNIHRKLGRKIDGLLVRVPWNGALYEILKELYTSDEAEVAVKMPYGLATFDQVARATGFENDKLRKILENLCAKGLVMDIWIGDGYRYMLSPLVIGIFEFTMMRTGENLETKKWAGLFHSYMSDNKAFYKANFGAGQRISPLRAIPYEESLDKSEHVEILDYEKASAIIEQGKAFAIGICSCRHEKLHVGHKTCAVPLETCSTIGISARYMTSHGFARKVSKTEMLENIARSKEMGLVLCADNVRKDVSFICHCCGCCCNVLLGISKFGYPNTVVTSSFIIKRDDALCVECGECAESCPVNAIRPVAGKSPDIDESFCLGCGVCASKCATGALRLVKRKQKVLHPADTFERVILQCLERGNLQNLLFSDINRIDHKFMRAFLGAFLRLTPVKRTLMGDTMRSSFLEFMRKGSG